ncbi:hypothetical protein B0T14DRAFT_498503 [Immersiella caudata]|uniref:Berberine/berberine-like domain-containing protein n=1 Tax=Immersiella caudata TaxID=314043 RepID=A0AA40BXR6_9PEZI|nr:hypothetical protein B0T14DRAFT_498503 [Immersiella caudata]
MIPDPGVSDFNIGGRIIPRSAISSAAPTAQLAEAIEHIVDCGNFLLGATLNAARFAETAPPNTRIVEDFQPKLEALTPGGGAYLNEAPLRLANWKESFFGANYDRLTAIKQRYDLEGIFYAPLTVG